MTLNHIHICSQNLGRSKEFYESFFEFQLKQEHGDGLFMEDGRGFLLAIDPVQESFEMPSWFHIGYCLSNKDQVRSLYEKMRGSGIEFLKEYVEYGDDAAAFYVQDPDGIKIEVSWHRD